MGDASEEDGDDDGLHQDVEGPQGKVGGLSTSGAARGEEGMRLMAGGAGEHDARLPRRRSSSFRVEPEREEFGEWTEGKGSGAR